MKYHPGVKQTADGNNTPKYHIQFQGILHLINGLFTAQITVASFNDQQTNHVTERVRLYEDILKGTKSNLGK